jgi:glycosyltransferase XagB
MKRGKSLFIILILTVAVFLFGLYFFTEYALSGLLVYISTLLTIQSLFTLRWMLYTWNSYKDDEAIEPPKKILPPSTSFSILLPVRHEEKVLPDTLRALEKIEYPKELVEIIILIREDDLKTIAVAKKIIEEINAPNIYLKVFNGSPINKPHSLNIGLEVVTKDVVVIFDAEDEPHPGLLNLVNTEFINKGVSVVQAGVQLIDYKSHWYSVLNVLEYYFWYKSGLYYFINSCGAAPLGGNTVFFKTALLKQIGGWDEKCLAEDADIGVRISASGAKISVLYVEKYATKEETPHSLKAFIAQRTRWNQGFLQVLLKGDWLNLRRHKSKIIVFYLLISPVVQTAILIYTPIGIYLAGSHKFSVLVTLITYMPLYLVLVQIAVYSYGFYKFLNEYRLEYSLLMPFKIVIIYFPYQILLAFSSVRSVLRITLGLNDWEKTHHSNTHRILLKDV